MAPESCVQNLPMNEKTSLSTSNLHGEALTLAEELRGRVFHIPAMRELFCDWPFARNKHISAIQRFADTALEQHISNEKKLRGLKKSDMGGLIARWYPFANLAELETVTLMLVWVFVWDDEIDTSDSLIASNIDNVRAYSQHSLGYIRQELGLPAKDGNGTLANGDSYVHPNMTMFHEVGKRLLGATDTIQREHLYHELEYYIRCAEDEHVFRLTGAIPSVEEYTRVRFGSVGCRAFLAIKEYMLRFRLPESIIESDAMQSLWNETNILCYIQNDIFSVQKEILEASLLNLVTVLYWNDPVESKSLDKVSNTITEMMKSSMHRFEVAASALQNATAGDAQLNEQIVSFIHGCRTIVTGALDWYYDSSRYGLKDRSIEDGSVNLAL